LIENYKNFENELVTKSSILCLIKVLKTFAYYSDETTF